MKENLFIIYMMISISVIDCSNRDIDWDFDGDGFDAVEAGGEDCNDSDPGINPEAEEVPYDGIDQDCDGSDLVDVDGDSYNAEEVGGKDCDDHDPSVYPGATESCWDDKDSDCNGYGCQMSLSDADAKFVGENPYDYAGLSVSSAGDVNGDGYDDILIGAYGEDSGGIYAGAAYLILGPVTGEMDLSDADAKFVGENNHDYAGLEVSSAGDVNSDGYDDILIGAMYEDSGGINAGAAYLILGPVTGNMDLSFADAKFVGEESGDHAGSSVSSAGDVNGDGFDDILVGAAGEDSGGTDAGAAYLILGPVSGIVDLSLADAKLVGEKSDDSAGCSVSSAGDFNGDGYDDILVGACNYRDFEGYPRGAVYLILSPVTGTVDLSFADGRFVGGDFYSSAGASISSAGDVNADGYDDILIGDPSWANAYLIFGSPSDNGNPLRSDVMFWGEEENDGAGFSVSSAGDVNGDGYDDILVGAPFSFSGSYGNGAAYLIFGPVTDDMNLCHADAKFEGEESGVTAGIVSSAGDVNGDGYDDILIGDYGEDSRGYYAGAAYLIYSGS